MALSKFALAALVTLASVQAAPTECKTPEIIWDGRIPYPMTLTDFDSYNTSRYSAEFVLGAGQKFSEILKFPRDMGSIFDLPTNSKPVEVTINDKSIFSPGGNPQNGFRRSELLPITNNGTDATVQGVTTFHFSMRPDMARPLNVSHQYELVFIETNDFSSHVWTIKAGTPFGSSVHHSPKAKYLRLESSNAGGKAGKTLFKVPWLTSTWHNFAITTDWVNNKLTAYYSCGYEPLRKVVKTITNDATGKGQAHIGVLKLPTNSTDSSHNGYQQSNVNEGVIFGGVFVEKGAATLGI
ncbi:hypothetical protein BGX38DRAFT_1193646 [Terfezia claveryi]|nr:hypothetical protein BGX38DRAFT_1193646 [Terfezia claveryi]